MSRKTPLSTRSRVLMSVTHGALCLACLLGFATVASAQPPWENAVDVLQTSFTGPIARGLSLVAIVIGGLTFAYGEGGSKRNALSRNVSAKKRKKMKKRLIIGTMAICVIGAGVWWESGADERYTRWVRLDSTRMLMIQAEQLHNAAVIVESTEMAERLDAEADHLENEAMMLGKSAKQR